MNVLAIKAKRLVLVLAAQGDGRGQRRAEARADQRDGHGARRGMGNVNACAYGGGGYTAEG